MGISLQPRQRVEHRVGRLAFARETQMHEAVVGEGWSHGNDARVPGQNDFQAIEQLAARTRRYAAYQRKWMRRIPELVSVNANRSPKEVADEIVEVARTRKRLPAPRAV